MDNISNTLNGSYCFSLLFQDMTSCIETFRWFNCFPPPCSYYLLLPIRSYPSYSYNKYQIKSQKHHKTLIFLGTDTYKVSFCFAAQKYGHSKCSPLLFEIVILHCTKMSDVINRLYVMNNRDSAVIVLDFLIIVKKM